MKRIRRQFFYYFFALVAVSFGLIISKFGWVAVLLIFGPMFLVVFMNWDDKRYENYVQKKTSVGRR